ncbi:MAG: hypothetical protein ACTIMT_05360 [Marinomonadaceae bacterium]
MSTLDNSVSIRWRKDELYSRYLSIDLPLSQRSPSYKGKFGAYLEEIGIEQFPFNISLSVYSLLASLRYC